MVEFSLTALLFILIILGLVEYRHHQLVLEKIPLRIHVNGSRGKSSVTRLIAGGLRASGLKTLAKTTGTAPRIIDETGNDQAIHRLRSASIGEQVKLIRSFSKKNPDAIVMECMAVDPQYQWVSEQKMIRSTISVITNVRPDHLDEMGSALSDIAKSLGNTISSNGHVVTAENSMDHILKVTAENRNSKFDKIDSDNITQSYMQKFPYLEHPDNVALALKVCTIAGVDEKTALNGMIQAKPDPGASVIWKVKVKNGVNHFVNVFSANDPASTLDIWQQLKNRIKDSPLCIFLNTREDRRSRTTQLLSLIYGKIKPDHLVIRGDNLPSIFKTFSSENPEMPIQVFPSKVKPEKIINEFKNLNGYYIMGIGNIVGWGDQFINELKGYRL